MPPTPVRPNPLVCTSPFEWCEIHPGGQVFLCCPAWLRAPVGNLLAEPLERVWNGPAAVEIRKTILNGSFHRCSPRRCPRLATSSAPVRPRDALVPGECAEAIHRGLSVLPFGPAKLNLCYDRSCNLACPSCREDFHSASGEERSRAEALTRRIIAEASHSVREITLSGYGDPFASPAYRDLLAQLGPRLFPRLQEIRLHTNGQLWNRRTWESLPQLHPLVRRAEVSVDAATPSTYARNRRGGDFSRLLDNLEFLRSLPIDLKLSFVVQRNNFREMPLFVALAQGLGCRAYFSRLVNWGTFSRGEYLRRAVHLPGHPEHGEFLAGLVKLTAAPGVDLGNLAGLLPGGARCEAADPEIAKSNKTTL
ncbi:hypothetical protein DESUT3_09480 [Desulfuromonas versatilis]|uniref:Radical SAM protein n=1 Tax=Desulfuromonas versatilis TaxID=2802975 RepID=A0ABN6DWI9_9BACT|nr:radical SAM/SPASM domain-containing protein [Desulfuromonas versatilis]BCR03879.1 hypothetical protein DESUT3_09480 [Desulfuromonas versatilis]